MSVLESGMSLDGISSHSYCYLIRLPRPLVVHYFRRIYIEEVESGPKFGSHLGLGLQIRSKHRVLQTFARSPAARSLLVKSVVFTILGAG